MTLRPWQEEFIESKKERVFVFAERQVGKTTAAVRKAVDYSLANQGSFVLFVSPNFKMCQVSMSMVNEGTACKGTLEIGFDNGSVIKFVSADTDPTRIMGLGPIDIVIFDEAQFVGEEVYKGAVMHLDGQVCALFTVDNGDGWVCRAWREPGDHSHRIAVWESGWISWNSGRVNV